MLSKLLKTDNETYYLKNWTSEHFPWFPGFQISSMAKNENQEMPEINTKLSESKSSKRKHFTVTTKQLKSSQFII